MKKQISLLLHAFQFYSRVPVGKIDYSEERLPQSIRYFPLVGIVVGGLGGLVFMLFNWLVSPQIAAVTALVTMVLATGALHEDGWSDFFDGFGGGYTKERILEIMKDSRVGAYGVISLIFLFLSKYALLQHIDLLSISLNATHIALVMIAAHSSSRAVVVTLMKTSVYARGNRSKSSHSGNPISTTSYIVALITGIVPLIFISVYIVLAVCILYAAIYVLLKNYIEKKIEGYTGDILGALQQACEVAFYLIYCIIIPFI